MHQQWLHNVSVKHKLKQTLRKTSIYSKAQPSVQLNRCFRAGLSNSSGPWIRPGSGPDQSHRQAPPAGSSMCPAPATQKQCCTWLQSCRDYATCSGQSGTAGLHCWQWLLCCSTVVLHAAAIPGYMPLDLAWTQYMLEFVLHTVQHRSGLSGHCVWHTGSSGAPRMLSVGQFQGSG